VAGSKDVPISNSHHATWQEQLGEAYFRLGRLPESEAHLRRTLALLGQPVPDHPLGLVKRLLGQVGRQLWRRLWPKQVRPDAPAGPEDGEARLRQLYRTYERFTELVFLNNDVGLILYGTLHSLNVAEALGPSAELAHAYAQMCGSIGVIPVHSLARLYRRLANETVQRLEDPAAKVDVQWLTAVYAAGIGAWEEAEAKLAQAVEFFEKTANWKQWGLSLEVTSRVIYNRGQFTRLQEIADRLATVAFRTDDLLQQTWVYLNRLEYALFAEPEGTDTLALMDEALARVAQTREVGTIMMSQALLSVIQARAGAWEAAAAAADQGLSVILSAKTASFGMYVAYANTTATYLALWERQPGASAFQQSAKEACRAITGYARAFTFVRPRSLLYQGLLAWLEGRASKAHKLWRHSLARAADLQMPYEQGLVHYEIGRHLALDDPARGQHLSQAQHFFAGLHAHYDLRRVEAIMQQESGL
jgi:hypothetical protein